MLRHIVLKTFAAAVLCACATFEEPGSLDVSAGGAGKDGLRTIAALADGGFILAGWRDQTKPGHVGVGYLVNIAPDGSVRWDKDIVTNGENRVSNVIELEDGRLVIVVEEYPIADDPGQAVIMELSARGDIQRKKAIGGPGPDLIEVMRRAPDGGFMFAGESAPSNDGDYQGWIGKLSADYEIEWEHRIGEPTSPDVFQDLAMTPDGAVIGVGMLNEHSTDSENPARPWAAKITAAGEVAWTQIVTSGDLFALRGVVAMANGDVAVTGYSRKWDIGEYDSWIGVLSSDGEVVWGKELTYAGFDQLIALEPTEDGRFMTVGARKVDDGDFDVLLVRFSTDGDEVTAYQHRKPGRQFGRAVRPLRGDSVAVGGFDNQGEPMGQQLWFLKTSMTGADQ
ncbi:MAG: hypothetical protein AAGA09_08120 [Pseudomonadota bacterium]